MKTEVGQSMQGALQGQVQSPEQLFVLPCTPTVTSDHQPGEEAKEVKITVSQTCSAVAYNSQELERKATDFLTKRAATNIGTGYSLFGEVQVTVTRTTINHTLPSELLSFHAQGTWVYALDKQTQEYIKKFIAGKTKQEAARLLASMPGIEHASIRWGDETKLPKHTESIRVVVTYGI